MKSTFWLLGGAVVVVLAACATPPRNAPLSRGSPAYTGPPPTYTSGSAGNPSSSNRTATSAYAGSTANPPPDAQLLYQRRASDSFGSSSYTSRTQLRGPVTEEVYIGEQRLDPYQPLYRPRTIDGVLQPGYVPSGTTGVYDPRTGRLIPVRRP